LQKGISEYNGISTRKYDYELVILYDNASDNLGDPLAFAVHDFTVKDIIANGFVTNKCPNFNYPITPGDKTERFLKGNPLWFNGEFGTLDYYLRSDSSAAYYWNIEYDSWPSGDFAKYLLAYDSVDDGFLAYNLSVKGGGGSWWPWWEIVSGFDPLNNYGCHFAVFRLSNDAVKTLVSGHRSGIRGYCESLVPTYLDYKGFACSDLKEHDSSYAGHCVIKHGEHGTLLSRGW